MSAQLVRLCDQKAFRWVKPCRAPAGWGIGPDELCLGHNEFLDQARQYVCYALSGRAPISSYIIQQYSVGTGLAAVNTTDTALQNPITLSSGTIYNPIDGIDFPAPFIAQIRFTLGANDANGYAVSEYGLVSGDNTLLMHWVVPPINKTSDWTPSFVHRLAF